jgi:hypothetical protein
VAARLGAEFVRTKPLALATARALEEPGSVSAICVVVAAAERTRRSAWRRRLSRANGISVVAKTADCAQALAQS